MSECSCWWNSETGYLEACPEHETKAMHRVEEEARRHNSKRCPHGVEIGEQSGITADDIRACDTEADEMHILAFYSACDCCDRLMHHSTCGEGYLVLDDGRTLGSGSV